MALIINHLLYKYYFIEVLIMRRIILLVLAVWPFILGLAVVWLSNYCNINYNIPKVFLVLMWPSTIPPTLFIASRLGMSTRAEKSIVRLVMINVLVSACYIACIWLYMIALLFIVPNTVLII